MKSTLLLLFGILFLFQTALAGSTFSSMAIGGGGFVTGIIPSTTENGSVNFGYCLKDKEIEFFVKDTGVGILPEMQDKIFDHFRKANNGHFFSLSGTGLGLSISKGFVELLGGKIWVESEVGKGSVFYFTIPYNPAH